MNDLQAMNSFVTRLFAMEGKVSNRSEAEESASDRRT